MQKMMLFRLQVTKRQQRGFTLVELLVVLVIIGLIMGLVGPRVLSYLTDARAKTARLQIENFSTSLDLYFLDSGRYPTTSEGLEALVKRAGDTPAWNGPYLKGGQVPTDPWGRPYVYRSPGEHGNFDIYSLGPDGRGESDSNAAITSWKR
jgi:general secretion pathway protein G